jgi:hypothetical protein
MLTARLGWHKKELALGSQLPLLLLPDGFNGDLMLAGQSPWNESRIVYLVKRIGSDHIALTDVLDGMAGRHEHVLLSSLMR